MSENAPPVRPEHPPIAPPPPVRSLIRKLSEVMAAVERVPKRGHNDHFNYDFAREADLVEVVRAELAKRQVMIFPDVEKCETREVPGNKGPLFITRMEVNFTVEDGESGEQRIFKAIGEGEDNHDKGCYKAITGALKYALMKLFLIPTGDDPEASKRPRDQRDPTPESGSRPAPGGGPEVFPNFGRMKGQSIAGAPLNELEYYIGSARKTLADPSKARFHDKESALIGALEAELARQRGSGPTPPPGEKPLFNSAPGKPAANVYDTAVSLIRAAKAPAQVNELLKRAKSKVAPEEFVALEDAARKRLDALRTTTPFADGLPAREPESDGAAQAHANEPGSDG